MTDTTAQTRSDAPPDIPTEHPHIVRTEGVCGGRPRIKGTRIPVSLIAEYHRMGESVQDVVMMYPHLDPAAIYDAISYYLDHRAEIEAEIEANRLESALAGAGAELGDDGVIRFQQDADSQYRW